MPSSTKTAGAPKSKPQSRGGVPGGHGRAATNFNIDPAMLHHLIEDTVEQPRSQKNQD